MGIVGWIVLGLVAGVVAKTLLGTRAQHGLTVTILIGIAGALLGGWVASRYVDIDATKGFFDLSTWLIAVAGSMVLLLVHHAITSSGLRPKRRRHARR